MDLIFDFDQRQGLTNVRFEGLDGTESVTSLKQALSLLKIRHPAVTFREAEERMEYNDATDAEYKRMLETVKFIGSMWRYPDDPGESPEQHEMGALMLLAAAIEALSMFNVQYQMDDPVQP